MKDLFVTYEQALQLKELGFDEPCLKVGNPNGHILWKFMDVLDVEGVDIGDIMKEKFDYKFVEIPLKQQVLQWFREKHNLLVCIRKFNYNGSGSDFNGFYYTTTKDNEIIDIHGADEKSETYEEAEEKCIDKLIKIIKDGK
jgi:hypothetical protein